KVDCSAAALDWFLGAYGQPVVSIDDAIALVGPNTKISTTLGLLDARGPALASALSARIHSAPTTRSRRTSQALDFHQGTPGMAGPGTASLGWGELVRGRPLVRRRRLRQERRLRQGF